MKVKTLVEKLQSMNPDAEIKLHHYMGEVALFCLATKKIPDVVWLESSSDIDVGEELRAQLQAHTEKGSTGKEFYAKLAEIGFTAEQVEEHLGAEAAAQMKEAISLIKTSSLF